MILHGGAQSSLRPDTVRDNRCDYEAHEGRMQTGRRTAHAGSRLKPLTTQEGRTGEECHSRHRLMRGFTRIINSAPEQLIPLLNDYTEVRRTQ